MTSGLIHLLSVSPAVPLTASHDAFLQRREGREGREEEKEGAVVIEVPDFDLVLGSLFFFIWH